MPSRVSDDANVDLITSISVEEVAKAIRALPKGKAPGHDGIPMEFFHECEKEVAPDLHQAFEKAFDRIEWGFLFGALEKLGFESTWIRWIRALYKGVTSSVRMNGESGPDFRLARSVR